MKNILNYATVFVFAFLPFSMLANCIKGDCNNGYGIKRYTSGAVYEGNFKNGKCHGKGILSFSNGNKYVGYWQENYREGSGKLTFQEGHVYIGGFKRSELSGKGIMTYANGDKYDGNWENSSPNGLGEYFYRDGKNYVGAFVNGKFSGFGTMHYTDGSYYEGNWQDNKKHGIGTLHRYDGKTNQGEWTTGEFRHTASSTTSSSATSSSSSMSSKKLPNCNDNYCSSGRGVYHYSDGSHYTGTFVSGLPEGQCTVQYSNGDRYEGLWKNHAPHGKGVMYYASGRVLGAIFRNGQVLAETQPDEAPIRGNNIQMDKDNAVKIWAVVVGVGRYAHMPNLKFTDDDAYQIYAFLKSPEGGAVPDNQVKVLIDEDATRRNVLRSMRETLLKADENDVVLFYFSGHGLEGSFLPVDYDGYNNRIRHDEIKSILQDSRAKHKLVFADACHSGSLLAQKGNYTEVLKNYYDAFENSSGGLALMMSSKGEEVSLEDGGLRSGVFSHYLIRGLKGEADRNANKIVTVKELFDFVHIKVRQYTLNAQTPTLTGNFDDKMPVAVLR